MDQAVLEAIKRWPNVPAVYGWLSLSARGQWRIHQDGMAHLGGAGESIPNQQITAFINRNYGHDDKGRWFFQNGPQRVYVRIDAAPYIVSVTGQPARLQTHNNLEIQSVQRWLIDTQGRLFLECEHGPGMVCDHDLELVIESLITQDGMALLDRLQEHMIPCQETKVRFSPENTAFPVETLHSFSSVQVIPDDLAIDRLLGFVTNPQPD